MLQNIAYGLTVGAILYITSIGLSLTFGSMKIVNFAHGIIYTIGAYALVASLTYLTKSFVVGAILGILVVIPISYAIDRFIIRRLYGVSIDYAIIATYALVFIGVDAIKWIWGASPIPLSDPIGKIATLFSVSLPVYRLVIIAVSIATYVGLRLFFKKTIAGKIVAAGLEDRDAVRALGIDVNRYFSLIFVLGSCLAAVGGVLYAPITTVQPYMGFPILRLSFAVAIVGGLGNLEGTFVAALALGVLMGLVGMFWGAAAEAAVFAVMAIALILRPDE